MEKSQSKDKKIYNNSCIIISKASISMKKYIFITLFLIGAIYALSLREEVSPLNLSSFKNTSPIKKQHWGTCWAFATISSLESNILINKLDHTHDLSEYHLDKYNGFNRDGRVSDPKREWFSTQGEGFEGSNIDNLKQGVMVHLGGDYTVAAAYLSGTLGAVEESKTPSITSERSFREFGNSKTTGILLENNYTYVFPKSIQWLTLSGSDEEKRERIQSAISIHGSVASSQYMEDTPVGMYRGSEVHLNLTKTKPNHAVSLVGWDDDFLFKGHKGAWIVKDSDHIDEETNKKIPLFYIPYDDLITAKDKKLGGVVFKDVSKRPSNTKIYNHALHGWQYSIENREAVKNSYQISGRETLYGLGIYIPEPSDTIKITILKNGNKMQEIDYSSSYPGFYYLETNSLEVNKKDTIEIIQENKSNIYALDSSFWLDILLSSEEDILKPQWIGSNASEGESLYKKNNKWLDLVNRQEEKSDISFKNANFPILIYTSRYEK